jgi:methyltransferase (TIGR00027 family)
MYDLIPSRTALATTFLRAAHMHLDDPPPVLDDPFALRLLPGYQRRFIRRQAAIPKALRRFGAAYAAGAAMRAQVVVRARYAEDCLAESRRSGAARYVILGAGLDTFALRQRAEPIDVLEIDHPATQTWKRQLLKRRGITESERLNFLPLDFERAGLDEHWPAGDVADFISWLGTTYYLSRDAISATLDALAGSVAAGTQLVLDYWREPPGALDYPLLIGTRMAVALQGEPMRTFLAPDEAEALARQAGWQVRENVSAADQNRRYLSGRADGLTVPSFACLLRLER